MRALIALALVVCVSAELQWCPRGGTDCTDEQKAELCSDTGHCCIYTKPLPVSVRCVCKAGWAGLKCDKRINDGDWMQNGQDALRAELDTRLNTNTAKNVILFIGDGMSIVTVGAARVYKGQQEGRLGESDQFHFEKFPHTGLAKTYNVNHQIPGSAGCATAIMSGEKVNYGTIGVNKNVIRYDCTAAEGNEVKNIFNWAQDANKLTGVVTNTRVTHATPAATYAHSAARDWETDSKFKDYANLAAANNCTDIAKQFVYTKHGLNINVMMGGGRSRFLPNTATDPEYDTSTGDRLDGRDLIQEWVTKHANSNAQYVWNKSDFDAVDPSATDYLLGLFESSHMKFNYENKQEDRPDPTLEEMTEKAIGILNKGDDGFLLMVEGGRIDHGHHAGKARVALDETLEFDKAIKKALDMTDGEDTLIVVTSDHSHIFTWGGYTGRGNPILGFIDTFDVEPSLDGKRRTALGYGDGPGGPGESGVRADLTGVDLESYEFKQQATVLTGDESHGGDDVAVYANGPMAHLFDGVNEQNYLAHAMAYAACIGPNQSKCT